MISISISIYYIYIFRTGFRRTKNLKDMLVKSSVQPVTTPQIDNPGCFKYNVTSTSYKTRQHLSCRTDFVIDCAFRKKCNRQCVGSAIDFRRRLSNYKSHIKKQKRTCRLVNYFIDNGSDHPLDCLKFTLIEQVSNKTEDMEEREGYWEAQLWTFEPFGFNAKKEFNSGRRRQFLS